MNGWRPISLMWRIAAPELTAEVGYGAPMPWRKAAPGVAAPAALLARIRALLEGRLGWLQDGDWGPGLRRAARELAARVRQDMSPIRGPGGGRGHWAIACCEWVWSKPASP